MFPTVKKACEVCFLLCNPLDVFVNVYNLYDGLKAVDWVMEYKILPLNFSGQDYTRCYNVTFSLERHAFQRKAWTTHKSPFALFFT